MELFVSGNKPGLTGSPIKSFHLALNFFTKEKITAIYLLPTFHEISIDLHLISTFISPLILPKDPSGQRS